MSHRLAEAWHPALRRASPTHSAATPEGRSLQKTMNLHHRNVPWLFGGRGQSRGRIHASPVALTQRSHSLTRKWTINRTMRWVSRAHFLFFLFLNVKTLVCCFHCITKGRNHDVEKAAVLGWKGLALETRTWLVERKRRPYWWGWYLERHLQLPFFGSKAWFLAPRAEKNLAFQLSTCESPGPPPQEAEEFDKVSPWVSV